MKDKTVRIFMAADHGGFELKNKIKAFLKTNSAFEIVDFGTNDSTSVDYPDYADKVCTEISKSNNDIAESLTSNVGFLFCGSGQGMAMRANKFPHVRAALCWNQDTVKLSREHNNANILCLGGRFVPAEQALEMVRLFLETPFAGDRHLYRISKIDKPTGMK